MCGKKTKNQSSHSANMIRRPLGVDGAGDIQYFYFVSVSTVEPLLNSHPQGTGKWPLNGGWPLNRGLS